jgi:hypothetical protein
MTACQYIPDIADASGNTLLCHYDHAFNALGADAGGGGLGANPHCWHAGPYGWGVCGGQCEDFCNLATTYCTPDGGFPAESGAPPFATSAACLAACPMFASASGDASNGIVDGSFSANGPASGNTRDCREYHLGAALTSPANQQIHCTHPAVNSPVCM